ncbi:MAG TPA: hypothetical protein VHH90_09305 [Polyangia bacterium]|nr:hypothetical protein [Polyangia bacterium]
MSWTGLLARALLVPWTCEILVPLVRDVQNRYWLTRAKSTTAWKVIQSLGKNEDLVEL